MPETGPDPLIRTGSGDLVAGFSGRRGGLSSGRFATANISFTVGDDPAAVAANRAALTSSLGLSRLPIATVRQRHTADVVRVTAADLADRTVRGEVSRSHQLDVVADGMVTTERDVVLLVGVADCVPVLVGDADRGAFGVLHVGWRGLMAGIVPGGLAALRSVGARFGSLTATIGPAVGPCCYPVGDDVRTLVSGRFGSAAATTRYGLPALDLPAAVAQALASGGVDDVTRVGGCTAHQRDWYFSYRRDGRTGCQGVLVAARG